MNAFVERVNGTVQTEYLDRFYEETNIGKINEILYDCLIEYNFYRPHRSLNLLTPIEYCSKLNNRDDSIVQMYWDSDNFLTFMSYGNILVTVYRISYTIYQKKIVFDILRYKKDLNTCLFQPRCVKNSTRKSNAKGSLL